jgi:hypothetical protein
VKPVVVEERRDGRVVERDEIEIAPAVARRVGVLDEAIRRRREAEPKDDDDEQ